jgi:endoglycosylceramidase
MKRLGRASVAAILFIEGHVTTNRGLQTHLPRPEFGNFAYSPHYYKAAPILTGAWRGGTRSIDLAFAHMESKAAEWDVPLFLSEFGAPAENHRAGDYVAYLYDRLDAGFSSGAQWNYTPHWSPQAKDGWNGEDFNIASPSGQLRGNFRPRPFPRAIAGVPGRFRYDEANGRATVVMTYDAGPDRGETEIYLPRAVFPAGSDITYNPPGLAVRYDPVRQVMAITAARPGRVALRITSP